MNREKIIGSFLASLILTILAIYQRQHYLSDGKTFEIEFGKDLLSPSFLVFSIFSGLILMVPLNFKVVKEAYRDKIRYYANIRDKKAFLKDLKKRPIETIANNDSKKVSKHLNLPEWLTSSLVVFLAKALNFFKVLPYISFSLFLTFLTLIIYIIWIN